MTREEIIDFCEMKSQLEPENEDVFNYIIKALELKQKTGHWILTEVEGYRIWRCKCSECGKDPQDYIYGSEDWWLTYGNLPKFCPTCGSRNF